MSKKHISENGTKRDLSKIEHDEEESLMLWKSPMLTLYYFMLECLYRFAQLRFTVLYYKYSCISILSLLTLLTVMSYLDGPHSEGPFIADVTMSAYECGTLKFPSPPYPHRILCPEDTLIKENITFWNILHKVQIESILWGIGTALGELPPYFMAQGARLSGNFDDEQIAEFKHLVETNKSSKSKKMEKLTFQKKVELFLHQLILRAGFIGILLCASIPNPLFDLAGMTCGHFLVPFWSFFGATVIGKAVIKVHLQVITIIALSSDNHVELLVEMIGKIPYFGDRLQSPFLDYLQHQKANLHNKVSSGDRSWIQTVIFLVVSLLIFSFVISIVHAFARSYHRRLYKWKRLAEGEIVSKCKAH